MNECYLYSAVEKEARVLLMRNIGLFTIWTEPFETGRTANRKSVRVLVHGGINSSSWEFRYINVSPPAQETKQSRKYKEMGTSSGERGEKGNLTLTNPGSPGFFFKSFETVNLVAYTNVE